MMAARAAVELGRVLKCLQVVGHRDYGKKDRNKHGQGDKLHTPVRTCARAESQPQTHDHDGQYCPDEIEGQLHSCSDSTTGALQKRCSRASLTGAENPLMMNQLAFGRRRSAAAPASTAARQACAFLLPPRSMVGQPPLERHIGVRIPGGQPDKINNYSCILFCIYRL